VKILILKNKGTEYGETCVQALRDLGHEVIVMGPGYHPQYRMMTINSFGWCDVLIHTVDYNSRWVPPLRNLRKLKVFWSMDYHMKGREHVSYAIDNRFDVFLNAVFDGSFMGYETGVNNKTTHKTHSYWFPNAYPEYLFKPVRLSHIDRVGSIVDVGFIGNKANRGVWIDELSSQCCLIHHSGFVGDAMVDILMDYQISWNRNIKEDINARTFETLGACTFLLTNNTPGLDQLFDIGKHLVTYESLEDCVEKIRYYLEHDGERNEIAVAGHAHAKEYHTWRARAKTLMDIIERHI
jgi:hypothetical protein